MPFEFFLPTMVFIFLTKLAIVAGTAYIINENGIWDDNPDRGVEIYNNIRKEVTPIAKDLKKKFCSRYCTIGSDGQKTYRESWIDAWNANLRFVFQKLSFIPEYCEKFSKDLQDSFNKQHPQKQEEPNPDTNVIVGEAEPKSN